MPASHNAKSPGGSQWEISKKGALSVSYCCKKRLGGSGANGKFTDGGTGRRPLLIDFYWRKSRGALKGAQRSVGVECWPKWGYDLKSSIQISNRLLPVVQSSIRMSTVAPLHQTSWRLTRLRSGPLPRTFGCRKPRFYIPRQQIGSDWECVILGKVSLIHKALK